MVQVTIGSSIPARYGTTGEYSTLQSNTNEQPESSPSSIGKRKKYAIYAGTALLFVTGVIFGTDSTREESKSQPLVDPLKQTSKLQQLQHSTTSTEARESTHVTQPHIVLLLADDIGWNDVGYHADSDIDNQIRSPNIDNLAASGIKLERFYTQSDCTPSRSALMTGLYPIHTGMYHEDLNSESNWGLPLEMTIIPQHLRKHGYHTYAVGKWDLGHYSWKHTPTLRGFDTFLGYYSPMESYFTHQLTDTQLNLNDICEAYLDECPGNTFTDLRHNTFPHHAHGKYSTHLFQEHAQTTLVEHATTFPDEPLFMYLAHQACHFPTQAPNDTIAKYHDEMLEGFDMRAAFGACISELDDATGALVQSLKLVDLYDNTVLIFASDNGGVPGYWGGGSNWPLRGGKFTVYEGGVRVPAFVHSPLLPHKTRGTSYDSIFHIIDMLPTILHLGGVSLDGLTMDGVTHVAALWNGESAPREEVLLHANKYGHKTEDMGFYTGAYLAGQWKLVFNVTAAASCRPDSDNYKESSVCGYTLPSSYASLAHTAGGTESEYAAYFNQTQLFDVLTDPSETTDLKYEKTELVTKLTSRALSLMDTMVETEYVENLQDDYIKHYAVFSGHDCFVTPWNYTLSITKGAPMYVKTADASDFEDEEKSEFS